MQRAVPIALLILALVSLSTGTRAQFAGAEPLTLTVSPEYPRPYQSITVIPESSVIDLAASQVTATVNGSIVSEGSGAEPIYVTMGGPGTTSTVSVRAIIDGSTYTKSIVLRPADVALIVESQSTTHPFYKGGALIAAEGGVRLVAVPDLRTSAGTPLSAANLVYTWRNGDQVLQGASGIGKSVLNATSPVKYRDARITVTVSTQDRSIVAESTVLIAPSDPLVRVYRNDPLLGPLYGLALPANITLSGTEESFRAVPYFFPERPAISWDVNGVPSDSDQDITVRTTGDGRGTARLGVVAKSPNAPQSAVAALSVDFGERSGFNFFGL